MMVIVPDPDAAFAKAIAAGAREITPVSEMHGWRVVRVVDPFGHHWEIARQLAELTYSHSVQEVPRQLLVKGKSG